MYLKFLLEPYKHQLNALELSKEMPNLALFWEMGTGKTGGMINILRYRYGDAKKIMPTLILSPLITLHNWKREFAIHSRIPSERIIVLDKSNTKLKKFMKAVSEDPNCIIITNYESMQSKKLLEALGKWQPEVMVCDESHLIKNYKSKRAKEVLKLGEKCKNRYILTGTPILNSPIDVFNQFKFLDKGATFGKNFFKFRAEYFVDVNAAWSNRPGHFPKFEPRTDKFPQLKEKIYKKALRVTKEECLDLPPLVKEIVHAPLSLEQQRMYKQMRDDFVTWVDSQREEGQSQAVIAQLAVTKALRLQQITTGFVGTDEGYVYKIDDCPRVKVAKDLLEQITPDHKVIVWCSFIHNYEQIQKVCKELGLEYAMIVGGQKPDDRQAEIDRFETEENCRVVIANRNAGGIGINLVAASYSIVYSRNFSLGEEKQSEARNHRGGSEVHERITKIDLVSPGTIDERVLEALRGKQEISRKIIDMVKGK